MSWLLEIASTIPVLIVWILAVQMVGIVVFRLLGKSFPLNPWRQPKQYRMAIQILSDFQYALWMGVFTWGWGVFLAIEASDYIGRRYFDEHIRAHSVTNLIFGFVIWTLAGFGFGYYQRKGFSGELIGDPQNIKLPK